MQTQRGPRSRPGKLAQPQVLNTGSSLGPGRAGLQGGVLAMAVVAKGGRIVSGATFSQYGARVGDPCWWRHPTPSFMLQE